jgi:hypothetical protein
MGQGERKINDGFFQFISQLCFIFNAFVVRVDTLMLCFTVCVFSATS